MHSSMRSFGALDPRMLVDVFLGLGCSLLVPTFSWEYSCPPPPDLRPARNGCDYDWPFRESDGRVFTPDSTVIDADMGALPAAVVTSPGRKRGDHPLMSFSSLGPQAAALVRSQSPDEPLAPLRELVALDGAVVLMGVGLTRMALLHLSEQLAGRELFARWARDRSGQVRIVRTSGCSAGFAGFLQVLTARTELVASSPWAVYEAGAAADDATEAIRRNPTITRCADDTCNRCRDAVAGGPVFG